MPLSNLPERQWRFAQTMRRGDELGLEGIVSSGAICPIARVLGASNAMRREQAVLRVTSHTAEGRAKVLQKQDTGWTGR